MGEFVGGFDGSAEDAALHQAEEAVRARDPEQRRRIAFMRLCSRVIDRVGLGSCEELGDAIERAERPSPREIIEASDDLLDGIHWAQPEWYRPFCRALTEVVERTWDRRADHPYGLGEEATLKVLDEKPDEFLSI